MLITIDIFKEMQTRFNSYVFSNNTDPVKIFSSDKSFFIWTKDLVALSRLVEDEFPVEYSNTTLSNPDAAPSSKSDLVKLQDKFGFFDTVCDFYDNVLRHEKCTYDYYYNQKFTVKEMIETLLTGNKLSANCTDYTALTCWIAQQLGYPFRVYNVICASGGGHVRPALIDKNDPGDWISTDPAAIACKYERRFDCLYDVWCDTSNGATIVDTSDKNCLLGWMHW